MKKRIILIVLFCYFVGINTFCDNLNSNTDVSDPAIGIWKSMGKDRKTTALWKFYLEDGKMYGLCIAGLKKPIDVLLSKCKNSYPHHPIQSNFNKQLMRKAPLIYNLKREALGVWKNGYIIDSRTGKCWDFDIIVHLPDGKKYKVKTLEIRGGWRIFKKKQYWEIATKEEANKIILEIIKKNGSEKARQNAEAFLEK